MVATCTAETSLGLGLRLVIIQAEPVSNIANPTLESDVAIEDDHEGRIAEQTPARFGARRCLRVDAEFGGQNYPPGIRTSSGSEICVPALRGFGKRIREDAVLTDARA